MTARCCWRCTKKYGADGVDRLRGQFAYAVHDTATGETHLFRDRLGILPLYYYVNNRVFAFASEIKALLPVHRHRPTVDEDSFHDYLAHRSVPAPYTLVKGVRKVAAGPPPDCRARRHGAIRLRTGGCRPSPKSVRVAPRRGSATSSTKALTAFRARCSGGRCPRRCVSLRRRRQQPDRRIGCERAQRCRAAYFRGWVR